MAVPNTNVFHMSFVKLVLNILLKIPFVNSLIKKKLAEDVLISGIKMQKRPQHYAAARKFSERFDD